MTSTPLPGAIPGWYPDPQDPLQLRYWHGQGWSDQTRPIPAEPSKPPSPALTVPSSSITLAHATQALVGICGLISLLSLAVEVWGFAIISAGARDPRTINLSEYRLYDQLTLVAAIGLSIGVIAAATTWIIWQYRLAVAMPQHSLRRRPGWHIAAWIIPGVHLWYPLQNVADLRGALAGSTAPSPVPRWYWAWWIPWLVANLSNGPISRIGGDDPTLSLLADRSALMAANHLSTVAAAVFAVAVINDLTRGVREALTTTSASPFNPTQPAAGIASTP